MNIVIQAWRDLANLNAGGSERHIDQLASSMTERGHNVVLLAGGPVEPRTYRIVDSGGTYSQYLRVPFLQKKITPRADLIVDVANGVTYCSPLWQRAPVLLVQHHIHGSQWSERFHTPIAQIGNFLETKIVPRIYRNCLVMVCSQSTSDSLVDLGVDADRIRVVEPGIEQCSTKPVKSSTPMFVVLGRLMPYKRVDLLLEIWDELYPQIGGVLHIIGDGPERSALEARGTPAVVFHGFVTESEKQRLLGESWMLVHGATHEGWGIAITEAAAFHAPAIAFDVAGVRDAVIDGSTGLLAESREGLAKIWIELASDAELRLSLGRAAAENAVRYSGRSAGDAFEDVAREAVERGLAKKQ
jgi:glycosyltransferase involved in cell wall biosynthesis